MNRGLSRGLLSGTLMVAVCSLVAPDAALGSPARRIARRGVVVGPPAAIVVPPAPAVVPVPAPPWAWWRFGPPGVVVLPPFPGVVPTPPVVVLGRVPAPAPERSSPGIASTPAPTPAPSSASTPAPPAAVAAPANAAAGKVAQARPGPTPAAAAGVEVIPAPRPATTTTTDSSAGAATAFTAAWYARHPDAWKPARMPTSPWKVADVATVTAWIGQPVVRANGSAGDGQVAQASAQASAQATSAPDADGLRSVLVLQSGHDRDAAATDEWLPLGVFAVAPPGGATAHNYQQIAVDHSGAIKGTFYDAISDTVLPITGAVDKDSLRAAWTVGANGSRFEAEVVAFSARPGRVAVTSGGATRSLELVPIDGP